MINKAELSDEVELVDTLKEFAQAYEEISVVRMQRVRGSVLATREFIEMLSEIFADVKANYRDEIAQMMAAQKQKIHIPFLSKSAIHDTSLLKKNKKTVSVFLSANTKLHGDIVSRSFHFFMDSIEHQDTDIVIVGKLGRDLFEQYAKGKPYQYFDLPEMRVSLDDLKPVMAYLLPYGRVNLYYGQFNNVIKQSPTVKNISSEVEEQVVEAHHDTQSSGVKTKLKTGNEAVKKFLFEPSVEKIIAFFNTEAFSSFVSQTVHESELAQLASRINAMEEALSNIDKRRASLTIQGRRLKHRIDEKKQLNALSSISLWLK